MYGDLRAKFKTSFIFSETRTHSICHIANVYITSKFRCLLAIYSPEKWIGSVINFTWNPTGWPNAKYSTSTPRYNVINSVILFSIPVVIRWVHNIIYNFFFFFNKNVLTFYFNFRSYSYLNHNDLQWKKKMYYNYSFKNLCPIAYWGDYPYDFLFYNFKTHYFMIFFLT